MLASELFGKQWIGEDTEIQGITCDSRKIKKGYVFVCIRGYKDSGLRYVKQAVQNGATVIVADCALSTDVPVILCCNPRREMALLAKKIYDAPDEKMTVIGVTGTNGKTTVTHLIRDIFSLDSGKIVLIGTNGCYLNNEQINEKFSTSTTPEAAELMSIMHREYENGAKTAVMEVSSHALALDRVYGMKLDMAIFTNLTQDHLDFHNSMEEYYESKKRLFETANYCIINTDDEYGKRLFEKFGDKSVDIGLNSQKISASEMKYFPDYTAFELSDNGEKLKAKISIPGKFSVYNALCAYAAGRKFNIPKDNILSALSQTKGVRGRAETIVTDRGFSVVIDYAHTPDGLENIIKAVRGYTQGRVITLFGCGGNRDADKRHKMGEISGCLSDFTVITSDNPRFENPTLITSDIEKGIQSVSKDYVIIEDRGEAIKFALGFAKKGDTVILAGKGHEDYIIVKNKKIHFDEREEIKKFFDRQ